MEGRRQSLRREGVQGGRGSQGSGQVRAAHGTFLNNIHAFRLPPFPPHQCFTLYAVDVNISLNVLLMMSDRIWVNRKEAELYDATLGVEGIGLGWGGSEGVPV